MDLTTLANFLLVVLFVIIGGVFAGTEMAIVNLRESQIKQFETSGPRGQRIAELVRNPNRFLAAVQIGVTVAGFFSSAYGASTIAPDLVPWLRSLGLSAGLAGTASLVLMTLVIAYLSLVLGELAPKRLAMQNAVGMTRVVAPPLNAFARLMRPVIWLLSKSTNAVVRLLGGDPHAYTEAVSVEEIRTMVSSSEGIAEGHRRILQDVFDAAERTVVEVMRPRPEVNFMAADNSITAALTSIHELPNSRYPVYLEDSDDIVGFVHLRDLFRTPDRDTTTVGEVARPILMFPGTVQVLRALAQMRREGQQIAIVVDEYGGTDGIVTLEDLLEEVVGEIYDEYDNSRQPEDSADREGGVYEVDGGLILQEFAQLTGITLPDNGSYQTVGGFVMAQLGRVARPGDHVEVSGHVLAVVDVERRRIGRVRVTRVQRVDAAAGSVADGGGRPGGVDGTSRTT